MSDGAQTRNDIEQRLAADVSGEATAEMIMRLRAAAPPVDAALRQPMPSEDFRAVDSMRQALGSAEGVLVRVWELLHPNKKLPVED
jgi:hypothetical protein